MVPFPPVPAEHPGGDPEPCPPQDRTTPLGVGGFPRFGVGLGQLHPLPVTFPLWAGFQLCNFLVESADLALESGSGGV